MTGRRVQIGQDVVVVRQTTDGLDLEGRTRLRPGQMIDLVAPAEGAPGSASRTAYLSTWAVIRLGSSGPMYAGHCSWTPGDGTSNTRVATLEPDVAMKSVQRDWHQC
jgi:hypothetical protein